MEEGEQQKSAADKAQATKHVGGVDDELGGVDPDIDQLLLRLSDGA